MKITNVHYPKDFTPENITIYEKVQEYTMTGIYRVNALVDAVRYVVNSGVPGAFVECGVWRGGSAMAIILTLLELNVTDRDIYLYDTFSGMTRPEEGERSTDGENALEIFLGLQTGNNSSEWCCTSLESVQENIASLGYPTERVHFIKGDVLDTIPKMIPERVSLLRLDTDWFSSTKHEMVHLYPFLSEKGILIVDDYGYWSGSKSAIDEYLLENEVDIYLARLDSSGRIAVKI